MEVISGSVCRACRTRLANPSTARAFSTSKSQRAVPPESPFFVDVPSTFQPLQRFRPQVRGVLPVPREIFPANKPHKATPEFVQHVTRDPRPENIIPDSDLSETGKYRSRMSNLRRAHLRESLTALQQRKRSEIQSMGQRSQAKQQQRASLLSQAEREDARLTNVSTPKEMLPGSHASLEVLRAELDIAKRQHAIKLANVALQAEQKSADKMDALHTLYMNARHFVTTEEQFNALIHEQFDLYTDENGDASHAYFKNDQTVGASMWSYGPPTSINDKVTGKVSNKQNVQNQMAAISNFSASRFGRQNSRTKTKAGNRFVRDQERFKRIAEKLSGGKI